MKAHVCAVEKQTQAGRKCRRDSFFKKKREFKSSKQKLHSSIMKLTARKSKKESK